MEFSELRKFLPDFGRKESPQPSRAEAVAASVSEHDADLVVELFAREALVALGRIERSANQYDDQPDVEVGRRLVKAWHDAGLDLADWSQDEARSDAEAILVTAVDMAARYPDLGVSIDSAVSDLAMAGRVTTEPVSDMAAELERVYGESLPDQQPRRWLEHSLRRMAAARLVHDTVGLGAELGAGPELRRMADRVVEQSRVIQENRRQQVPEVAPDPPNGEWGYRVMLLAGTVAAWAAGDMVVDGRVDSFIGGAIAVGVTGAMLLRREHDNRQRAAKETTQEVRAVQRGNASDRSNLVAMVDHVHRLSQEPAPPPTDSRGRVGKIWRGNKTGRRGSGHGSSGWSRGDR